jgi:multisubunit Na+/H+ antiporter MnhB subunit
MSFQSHHISILARYVGISFIAGAVNHGAFSENRSYLTALVGIFFYILGVFLNHRNNKDEVNDWRALFGFGVISSIGIGFFTGGLQHFIDSPERSVWVVPLGFILSVIALYFLEGRKTINPRSFMIYAFIGAIFVSGASFVGFKYFKGADMSHSEHDKPHSH